MPSPTEIAAFDAQLKEAGCQEVLDRVYGPDQFVPLHTHEFAARALVLSGEVTIACAEQTRQYRAGEIFELAAGTPHSEQYGPQGATYRAGRLYA